MPLNTPVRVVGMLEREPSGLVLREHGDAYWQLHQAGNAHKLVGRRVEVAGYRIGFNDIACDCIWPAGEPQPRARRVGVGFLIPAGVVVTGLIASLAGWFG